VKNRSRSVNYLLYQYFGSKTIFDNFGWLRGSFVFSLAEAWGHRGSQGVELKQIRQKYVLKFYEHKYFTREPIQGSLNHPFVHEELQIRSLAFYWCDNVSVRPIGYALVPRQGPRGVCTTLKHPKALRLFCPPRLFRVLK